MHRKTPKGWVAGIVKVQDSAGVCSWVSLTLAPNPHGVAVRHLVSFAVCVMRNSPHQSSRNKPKQELTRQQATTINCVNHSHASSRYDPASLTVPAHRKRNQVARTRLNPPKRVSCKAVADDDRSRMPCRDYKQLPSTADTTPIWLHPITHAAGCGSSAQTKPTQAEQTRFVDWDQRHH